MVKVEKPIRGAGKNLKIPIPIKLKARNLYVTQGLSGVEVAKQVGLQPAQVYRLAQTNGWTSIREERHKRMKELAEAREISLVEEVADAIADECEDIALQATKCARDEIASSGGKDAAKNFQCWTAGIRNLVTARNLARGIQKSDTSGSDKVDTGNVNLFFFSGTPAPREREQKRAGETVDSAGI